MLLDEYERRQATNEIEIEDARLLLTCMGNTLSGMQKGGSNLQAGGAHGFS